MNTNRQSPSDYRHPQQPSGPLPPFNTSEPLSRRASSIHQLPPPTMYNAPTTDPAYWSSRPSNQPIRPPSRPWSPLATGETTPGDSQRAPSGFWNRAGRGELYPPDARGPYDRFYRPQSAPSHGPLDNQAPPTASSSSTNKTVPNPLRSRQTPSPSPSPTSPSQPKQKKRRVALSCAECAKRKQRCNREIPCQHCVARRVPELCVPYSRPPDSETRKGGNASTDDPERARIPTMLPTLSVRVGRIEALLNAMVNRVDGVEGKALDDWRINHAPALHPPPLGTQRSSETSTNNTASPPNPTRGVSGNKEERMSPPVYRDDNDDAAEEVAVVDTLDRDSLARNPLPQSMQRSTSDQSLDHHREREVNSDAQLDQMLFEDCGIDPKQVRDLMRELPAQPLAGELVNWFFAKINYVRYPIDEQAFRQAFNSLYSASRWGIDNIIALPLVYIVFALSTRVSPDEWGFEEERKRSDSLAMFRNTKSAIMIASTVKPEHIQLVEARILNGLYLILMHDRRLAEGWQEFRSAITIGQAIGLHRDGCKLGLNPHQTEYRRWLWSYLIHADATYSCLLGRPTSIDLACADTQPPSNLDIIELTDGRKVQPRPRSEPTFATYLILRRRLGEIVAKITQHFQRLQGQTSYRDVQELDAEFKDFVEDLPRCFKMFNPDKSFDGQLWFLPVHRYYIQTEILHFIIILHRPWLLRRLRSKRYALSRNACFEAAITDFKIRQAFKHDHPDFFETLLGGSFREFNVAMIAGISIIIDPHALHVNEMRAIVEAFLAQFPHDPKADDFSQKEASIIHTLHRRAQELSTRHLPSLGMKHRKSSSSTVMSVPSQRPLANVSSERTVPVSGAESSMPGGLMRMRSELLFNDSPPGHGDWNRQSGDSTWMGSSSGEEDHSQQLLDHWIMSNTSFGPGTTGPMPNAYAPMAQMMTQGQAYQGVPGWSNPSDGSMMPMSEGMGAAGNGGGAVDGGNGLGNNVQYWDTLIDGIVGVGMTGVGYDMSGR